MHIRILRAATLSLSFLLAVEPSIHAQALEERPVPPLPIPEVDSPGAQDLLARPGAHHPFARTSANHLSPPLPRPRPAELAAAPIAPKVDTEPAPVAPDKAAAAEPAVPNNSHAAPAPVPQHKAPPPASLLIND